MTNQPRQPLRSDVSRRAQWEIHSDGDDPPINPCRRDTDTAAIAAAVGAQDRPWRELLNSTPISELPTD